MPLGSRALVLVVFAAAAWNTAAAPRPAFAQEQAAGSQAASSEWLEGYAGRLGADELSSLPLENPELRAARIREHHPLSREPVLPFAPPNVAARVRARWGMLLEKLALYAGARDAYAHSIGLTGGNPATWRRLAHTRIRTGDLEGAEAALLAAIGQAEKLRRRQVSARLYNELGELYLLMDEPAGAISSLERGARLSPHGPRDASLLERARFEQDPDGQQRPGHMPVLWPLPPAADNPLLLLRSAGGVEATVLSLGAVAFLTMLLLSLRSRRRHGDLIVSIHYPPELRGLFSVRISNRKGHFKRMPRSWGTDAEKNRPSTRSERYQVSRETHFAGLPAGDWYVTIEGTLREKNSGEIIASPFEERRASVVADQSGRLELDLRPPGCPVEVSVMWDRRPAEDAAVGVLGLGEPLRYTRSGSAMLRLPHGRHRIAVGSNDRVLESEIEIESYTARRLAFNLSGSEGIVFKACPPAVEPYMNGDIGAAARALEQEGQSQCSQLLLAQLHRDLGNIDRAAEHFEAAGHPREAAELQASLSNHSRAAALFMQAGEPMRAADLFSAAGAWMEAGEAYESAGDFANAAASYGEAGDSAKWAAALDRHGKVFDAAMIALGAGDRAHAIQLLQRVPQDDAHFGEACRCLADCYEEEGHLDLALHKLQEALDKAPDDGAAPDLRSQIASLLESTGAAERALSVLDELRQKHPTYPNLASRIEALRKRLSAGEVEATGQTVSADSVPTAFITERRYELLEEIGRGGMGIVFRARDRRLDRIVALKQLPQQLRDHPRAIELFLREAKSAARLNHPNVVTIYDSDQQDGQFFITMELLKGYPLNVILAKKGALKVRDALRLAIQVAAGLEYAHQQRIVHRDIKTDNLFFTRERVVKIMDFGLAKMLEEVRRATTIVGGTPYYMAPEQGMGGEVDHRADLYAFGVTLYQMVTGILPFPEGDVTYQHRHVAPPDPRSRMPDLPPKLAELILQMLQKKPEARPESAGEIGERLEALLKSK